VPEILAFIRRNCTTWYHNGRQFQGLTSDVAERTSACSPLHGSGVTPKQFVALFDAWNAADMQVKGMFAAEFGAEIPGAAVVNSVTAGYKINYFKDSHNS